MRVLEVLQSSLIITPNTAHHTRSYRTLSANRQTYLATTIAALQAEVSVASNYCMPLHPGALSAQSHNTPACLMSIKYTHATYCQEDCYIKACVVVALNGANLSHRSTY